MNFCLDVRTVTSYFPGIGRYSGNLARAMADQLQQAEQLILIRNSAGHAANLLPKPRAGKILAFDTAMSPFGLRQQFTMASHLRGLQTDIYHSPYFIMPYRVARPVVVTIHDLIPQLFPEYNSLRSRVFFKSALRAALTVAREVITVSEATRRDLLKEYPLDPDTVTSTPLAPAPCFKPQPKSEVRRVMQCHGLGDYVLYLGGNKPHKNLVNLLEAWRNVKTRAKLVIAGRWDARYPEAKVHAADPRLSNRVTFLGPVAESDLPALYAGAELFVFPSLYEGYGLPVIEAMACGTPVACSNSSSVAEVSGDAALLFNPRKTDEIATAISEVLESGNLRHSLRDKGLQRAAVYTWYRTAEKTLMIYRRLHEASG